MQGTGTHYGQFMVDQRPVFDNAVRKRKKKKKKHGDQTRNH
jgi:hypothetical protein